MHTDNTRIRRALVVPGALALVLALGACQGKERDTGADRPSDGWSEGADGNRNKEIQADEAQQKKWREELLEYAKCLRENGWKDAPDPDASGAWGYDGEATPEMEKAQEACREVLKNWNMG